MKRISKVFVISLIMIMILAGCGKAELTNVFDVERISSTGNPSNEYVSKRITFASNGLCVVEGDIDNERINPVYIKAAAAFNITRSETLYAFNVFDKNYPASTTKILTAYLTLKNASLDDYVTITKEMIDIPEGAATAALREGDIISVRELLYGLMLPSGNDAARALAIYTFGSLEAFNEAANKELETIYATKSHFVNPNGIHNDDHYTSVYDMYLIFNEAIKDNRFVDLISTKSREASVTHKDGDEDTYKYKTTNKFLNGDEKAPEGYKIIGGKTGTTNDAGKCLVLLAKNSAGDDIIFIVFGADSKERLYDFMAEMMRGVE